MGKQLPMAPPEADRVTTGHGADRRLYTAPPGEGYRQVGWHCIYHEAAGRTCHNPTDCDLVPIWALNWDHGVTRITKALKDG